MTAVDHFYSFYLQVNEESGKIVKGWEKHFEWLDDVVQSAIESRGKTVIPKTPAARKRKRNISKENIDPSTEVIQNVEKQVAKKQKAEIQEIKETVELEILELDETDNKAEEIPKVREESKRVTRLGRKRKVNEDVNEISTANNENTTEHRTEIESKNLKGAKKKKVSDASEISNSFDEVLSPKKLKGAEKKRLKEKEKIDVVETEVVRTPVPAPRQRPIRVTRRMDASPCTPSESKAFINNEEIVNKQKTPRAKINSTSECALGTDNLSMVKNTQLTNTASKSVSKQHSVFSTQSSYSNTETLTRPTTVESKRDSAVKVVKHAWSATGKPLSVRTARLPYTASPSMDNRMKSFSIRAARIPCTASPSVDNRMKVLQMKNLSASKTCERSTFLKSSLPSINTRLAYQLADCKSGNIVTGISSFINRVQPVKPSKKDLDEARKLELERKIERDEEMRRKKDEMMKARQDEKKRKNEERMRRVQETRENKERQMKETRLAQQRERKQRDEEKIKEEQERKQREEDKIKEEREKKKRQISAKKEEEEMARLIRIKEQEERELRLEAIRKEEEIKQLQERRQLEEQKRYELQEKKLLEQKKLLLEQKLEEQRIRKEKYEEEKNEEAKRVAAEEERKMKEKQQQLLKPIEANPNATFTKDSPNTVTSYEMTPVPKKKKNSNNYCIDECRSDDSTDDDRDPKKDIPSWAKGQPLKRALFDQEYFAPNIDLIFPSTDLLLAPNLDNIFYRKRSRFFTRTSSANWNTPPLRSAS